MSFFEPPSPQAPRQPDQPQPAWIGPAENVLAASVGIEVVLARTGDVGIGVSGFVAEPNGVSFLLDFRRRFGAFPDIEWWQPWLPDPPTGPRDASEFRFGVQLADGRKVTTLHAFGDPEAADPTCASPPPRLVPRGGSGGAQHSFQQGYWLWPLPPPGPLAFVCEWQAVGIPLTRVEVDATPVIAGAARATLLWELPASDPERPPGWTSY